MRDCADCRRAEVHCHAAVVLHADDTVECVEDPDCRVDWRAHIIAVSCAEAGGCVDCNAETMAG